MRLWARRPQLFAADVRAILSFYPSTDAAGFDYGREPDNGAAVPVPPGVVGTPLGRRAGR